MTNITKRSLVKLILVSTFFMVPASTFGETIVSTPTAVPPTIVGDLTITSTGSLTNLSGIDVASKLRREDILIIDPNNINPAAINTTGDAIAALWDHTEFLCTVIIGENSTVQAGSIGVDVSGITLDLANNGTITSSHDTVHIQDLAGFKNIINTSTGLMESTGTGHVLNIGGGGSGTLVNNSGIMKSANADTIFLGGPITITNGIVNSGTITAGGVGNNALNLGGSFSNITFTNNAPGIVNGNIIVTSNTDLSTLGSTVLIMNGGTINGTVKELAGFGVRVFEVNGGTITGGIDLSLGLDADIIRQSGGTIGNILGHTAFNQQLFILGPVTTGGTITNLSFINVQDSFTINHAITNLTDLNILANGLAINNSSINVANLVAIDPGGVFQANPTGTLISNTLSNNGTLNLKVPTPASNVNVSTASYSQSAATTSAMLEVEIKDKSNFGNMNITGPAITDVTNRLLKIDVTGTGLIRNLDTFRVVHNTGTGTFAGSFLLLEPLLSTIRFIDVSTRKDIILEALRTPFADLTTSDITTAPAQVIDEIINSGVPLSPSFEAFVIALDGLSPAEINTALTTVVPQFDGGLVQLSHTLQKNVFNGIGQYIDEHRPLAALIPCYVAGDVGLGRENGFVYSRGNWGKVFASRASQQEQQVSAGYDLDNVGFILGYDQYCSDRVLLGGALSYATGEVRSKATSASRQEVTSFQVTGYSTFDYKGPGYLDVMGAVSFNEYNSTRNIVAGSFFSTALGQFNSWQYGVNLESGYRFSYGKYRIIPVGRLLYSYLQIDNYTETGAGGLNLSVVNKNIQEGVTGIGIKFNSTNYYQAAAYVPEFRFNILYDWIADGQVMTSDFLEGGSPFITNAIRPNPCTYNVGLSFTALAQSGLVLVLNYDVDINKGYVNNSVSMKFRYEW